MVEARSRAPRDIDLGAFFHLASALAVVADLEGQLLVANPAWQRVTGYTPEELQGTNFLDLVHPEDRAATVAALSVLGQGNDVAGFVNRYVAKDGTIRHLRWQSTARDGLVYATAEDVTEQQEALSVLARSESRYEVIFNATAQGIVLQLPGGEIRAANAAAQEILGLTLAQMQGRDSMDPRWRAVREDGSDFPGDEHPAMISVATGEPVRNVIMGVHNPHRQHQRWLRVNSTPLLEDGRVTEVFSTFDDITEDLAQSQRIASQNVALQRATDMLRQTGLMSRVGGFEYHTPDGFLTLSPGFVEALQLSLPDPCPVAALLGRFAPDESTAGSADLVRDALIGDEDLSLTARLRLDDGRHHWMRVEVRHAEGVTTGSLQDIDAELESRARIEGLTAALNDHAIVTITDRWGRITFANENFERVSGYSAADVVGRTHRVLNSGHHPKEFFADLWDTIKAGKVWRGVIRNQAKDGRPYWVLTTIVPLTDAGGEITSYISVRTDISRIKAAEQEARAASQAKTRFLANMSHEIRTPLNSIIGLSHLAAEESAEPATAQALGQIRESGRHLLEMLNDILDFSKLSEGTLSVTPAEFVLADTLQQVVGMYRSAALQKGLDIAVEVAPGVPERVVTDPMRLRQVLLNLLSNAVKFTESGGVRIGVTTDEASQRPALRFDVSDTGVGIAAEDIPHLFDPFSQLDTAPSRSGEGTGLGLSICHQLVEHMGGTLTAASEPGQGSTFSVVLPQLQVTTTVPSPAEPAGPMPTGRRVLVVDDQAVARELSKRILLRAGMEVITATNGQEAIALFRDVSMPPADLVLMDLHMPDMHGFDVTRQIRGLPFGEHVPIVALTANALSGDRDLCLAAGMNDHLAKPFDPTTLVSTVGSWLSADPDRVLSGELDDNGLKDIFLAEAPDTLARLRQAVEDADEDGVQEAAHTLKGSAGAVGARQLAESAALVESHCRAGTSDMTGALDLVAQAESYLEQLRSTLAAERPAAAGEEVAGALRELREKLTGHDWVDPRGSIDLVSRLKGLLPVSDAPERLNRGLLKLDYVEALAALDSVEREVRGSGES